MALKTGCNNRDANRLKHKSTCCCCIYEGQIYLRHSKASDCKRISTCSQTRQQPETQNACRKVRVSRDSYAQSGRAGDLSIRTGPIPRVEDESAYRQHTIDSPSFVRFCQNLPKLSEVGPHQRHHAAVQRQEAAVQQSAAEEVMRLDAWEDRQQERCTAALAAQQAVPAGKKK
jgi:hypothetical protein